MGPDCEGRGVSCDVAVGALHVPATVCWHVLLIVCLTATNCVTLIKLKQPDTLAVTDYLAHFPRVPCLLWGMFSSKIYICFPSVTRWHVSTSQQTSETSERDWRVTNYHFLNTLDWLAQWACVTSFCRAAQNGGGRRTHDCIRRHYFWPQKQVLIWMEVICYDSLPLPPAPARKREPGSREL